MSENELKRKIDDIAVENEAKKLAVENDQKEDIIAGSKMTDPNLNENFNSII